MTFRPLPLLIAHFSAVIFEGDIIDHQGQQVESLSGIITFVQFPIVCIHHRQ